MKCCYCLADLLNLKTKKILNINILFFKLKCNAVIEGLLKKVVRIPKNCA